MSSQSVPTNYDFFTEACQHSDNYPVQLPRSRYGTARREEIAESLNERAKLVFNPNESKSVLKLTELCTCFNGQNSSSSDPNQQAECNCEPDIINIRARDALVKHLQNGKPNPRLRYLSIQSPSSRDRLDCSLSKFKFFSTYHEIPPSFLDHVYSFKASLSPCDYNLAGFKDENTLLAPKSQSLPLKQLERSGREIRYSFLLRSIESSTSIPNQPWAIRQLAVYHSFDVARIKEALSENPAFEPSELKSVPNSFAATLEILLMILDWCDENWRWYINDIVDEVGRPTDKATTVTVVDEADLGKVKRLVTGFSGKAQPKPNNKQPTATVVRSPTSAMESGTLLQDLKRRVTFTRGKSDVDSSTQLEDIENLRALKIFSFNELQELQRALDKIQSALLVLKLNYQAIKQIRQHYESLMADFQTPEMDIIRNNCKHAVLRLSCRSKDVEANIEARQAQLDTLLHVVQEGKSLYDGILQYRSLQINKIYAESAQLSARKMEAIANKTKQETSSMHIITVVTLIFLPGTFIASFFQSGILEWAELKPDEGWKLNTSVFGLFMKVSCTMMAILILIWATTVLLLRRQSRASANRG
ncbi:hypothetical protein FALBO_4167 [Fusarium albosuccineum]|uniref:CorA-like transporter domain-containing protein n=1 Tax=Fusarium albosuccineum TaxID=1237068 RepID=A0A8H4LIH1_9HYPO|nr:hypothetical protein FALBO_4167 [Fusarium albosuccineum]